MKKTEELVDTMRQCGNIALGCGECQFKIYRGHDAGCIRSLMTAAADRLEEYVDRCARFSEEIMVLRAKQRNDPITLDELKEMDGEPVWVVWLDGRIKSRWHIVGSSFWMHMFFEWNGAFSPDYGKTWLAYRHKTEEVSNGKDG